MEVAGKIQVGDGSTTAPSLAFRLDTNTGLYRPGADRLVVVTGGSAQWEFDASGHLIPSSDNAHDVGSAANSVRDIYIDGSLKGSLPTTSWTPSLTAATTNPTLGTGSSATGYYLQWGKTIIAWGRILFGSSGANKGSGQYRVSLPVTADTTIHPTRSEIGTSGGLAAAGAWSGSFRFRTSTDGNMVNAATGTSVADSIPNAFTNNDEIHVHMIYQAA